MRVEVCIERIVVDGSVYDGNAGGLREAIAAGLARSLATADVAAITAARDAERSVDLSPPSAGSAQAVGAGIADAISRVIVGGEVK